MNLDVLKKKNRYVFIKPILKIPQVTKKTRNRELETIFKFDI